MPPSTKAEDEARMTAEERLLRFQEFQSYVAWTDGDAERVTLVAEPAESVLPRLVDDFYDAIHRHDATRGAISGGPAQVERLKLSLVRWIRELLSGKIDSDYIDRRWQVGWRHADIKLDAVFVNLALSRLRDGLCRVVEDAAEIPAAIRFDVLRSLNKRLDLDLAIIEDAYQHEHRGRLQSSERLATIGQVTGGVAHELRNPLNVVKTSVYYLLNARNPSPEKSAEHLHRIERHVNLADSVIIALSNFARLPIPSFATFSIAGLFAEILADNLTEKRIQVEVDIDETLPEAVGDRDQIRIVLGNLIRNGFDAMPDGGVLGIRAGRIEGADRVKITVCDNGVGISRENLSRIMEPLFSTKARGLGLGLAIARAILDKHRGQLRVVSELGKGSEFTIEIPAVPDASPTLSRSEPQR